jgi:phosphoribosylaminoimidazole (AIR) synthetase
MGVGLVVGVAERDAAHAMSLLADAGEQSYRVGRITAGQPAVTYV